MDDLDRFLSSEDELVPSAGFHARVMEGVRDSIAAPPPLPFPWGRFALGVAACVGWAALGVELFNRTDFSAVGQQFGSVSTELGYAAAAAVACIAALRRPRALMSRR